MKNLKIYTPVLLLILLFLLTACGGEDDASATSMRLRKTKGKVSVSDAQNKALELMEDLALYSGYGVKTRTKSYAWVELDSVKLAKLDESSKIAIEKDGKNLTIQLENGNLFFHITEPLGDDESMEIRTSTMAIGIRGTCGWVEAPKGKEITRVYILEGKVDCLSDGKSASVTAGEMAELSKDGEIAVEAFEADTIPSFVQDEAKDDEVLEQIIREVSDPTGSDSPGGSDAHTAEPDSTPSSEAEPGDHPMDWQDAALAQAMSEITGISGRDIMLSDVWGIRELELKEKGIRNISALKELTNLTQLNLFGNNISDISPLGGLKNLTNLWLGNNNISDISALSGLKNLQLLWIGNGISDISPLSGLTNLVDLTLQSNQISDISALGKLTNLRVLWLGDNNISDISALGKLKKLTRLSLWGNNISDISPLSRLAGLEELYLGDNRISDVSALGSLPNIKELGLSNNNLGDISTLGTLTTLRGLYLNSANLSNVSPLASLRNLQELDLAGNRITDYSPVEFVPDLVK